MYAEAMMLEPIQEIPQEKTIFNGLTTLLNNFNQILISMNKAIIYCNQVENKLMHDNLKIIQERAKTCIQFIELPTSWINNSNNSNNIKTYHRFISRLIESINPLKQKAAETPYLSSLLLYLKEIEKIIGKFCELQSLSKIMKMIFKLFLVFCQDIRKNVSENGLISGANIIKLSKLSVQKKFMTSQKTFYVESDSQKKMKKLIKNLNQTFNTMKGMDLDYTHYRSSFFEIKNNFDVYGECLKRNKDIKSNIQIYSKNFKDYISKKQKKKIQRDRLNLFRRTKFIQDRKPYSDNSKHYKKKSFDFNIKKISHFTQELSLQQDSCEKDQFFKEEKKEEKTFYQMKNIVLSASKIKISPIKKEVQGKTIKNMEIKTCALKSKESSPPKIKLRSENRSLIRNLRQITKDMKLKY